MLESYPSLRISRPVLSTQPESIQDAYKMLHQYTDQLEPEIGGAIELQFGRDEIEPGADIISPRALVNFHTTNGLKYRDVEAVSLAKYLDVVGLSTTVDRPLMDVAILPIAQYRLRKGKSSWMVVVGTTDQLLIDRQTMWEAITGYYGLPEQYAPHRLPIPGLEIARVRGHEGVVALAGLKKFLTEQGSLLNMTYDGVRVTREHDITAEV